MKSTMSTSVLNLKEVERILFFTDLPCGWEEEKTDEQEAMSVIAAPREEKKLMEPFDKLALGSPFKITQDFGVAVKEAQRNLKDAQKEAERAILFTDVPEGALKKLDINAEDKDESLTEDKNFIEMLQRVICFTDLQDIKLDEKGVISPEDMERIRYKSMQKGDEEEKTPSVATEEESDEGSTNGFVAGTLPDTQNKPPTDSPAASVAENSHPRDSPVASVAENSHPGDSALADDISEAPTATEAPAEEAVPVVSMEEKGETTPKQSGKKKKKGSGRWSFIKKKKSPKESKDSAEASAEF